jgi:arylsulfatase A-like enzyme
MQIALWLAMLAGCRPEPAPPPHLLLIAIDTLRADHLGAYGYPRPTSPNIDQLARKGTTFDNAFAPSSWTRPSVASLFTSRPPSEHGAVSFDRAIRDDLPTLAEALQRAGYRTLGVSGNFVHVNEETGLARGFDDFEALSVRLAEGEGDVLLRLHPDDAPDVALRAPSAEEVNRKLLSRLPASTETPLFLYVHYMEPHAGYLPPEPFRTAFLPEADSPDRSPPATSDRLVELAARPTLPEPRELARLRALYDGEIAATDHALGELLAALGERGFGENAVVVLLSDHGEEFGEHGGLFHGITLHGESLRVPLVIHDARRPTDGVRRDEPVDLLDVAPTILALAGIAPDPAMRGRPLLEPSPLQERDLVAELHPDPTFEAHLRPRPDGLALVRWPWKVIVARDGAVRAYRLDRDPAEDTPLGPERMPEGLLGAAQDLARRADETDAGRPFELDDRSRRELRALGYAE